MNDRCQVCGRRAALKADGKVRLHHRRSVVCLGSGRVPYEQGCDAIEAAIAAARAAEERLEAIRRDHQARRLNEPLSAEFWQSYADELREALRLERRLELWRTRVERRQAYFDRHGWSAPW